jgi:hypothetical protein
MLVLRHDSSQFAVETPYKWYECCVQCIKCLCKHTSMTATETCVYGL